MTVDEFVKHAKAYGYYAIDRTNDTLVTAWKPINVNSAKIPACVSLLNGKPSNELLSFIKETQEVERVVNEVRTSK